MKILNGCLAAILLCEVSELDTSGFRGDAGTTFVLTRIFNENCNNIICVESDEEHFSENQILI